MNSVAVGLIGDRDEAVPAHRAIPIALRMAALELECEVFARWIPTASIDDDSALARLDGLWCVPASPYRSMKGALRAIQFARETSVPFLGTCGGFQHAVIEFARNCLGWADADHAESCGDAVRPVVSRLECPLVEQEELILLLPDTRLRAAYEADQTIEAYRCRYGLDPRFSSDLLSGALRAAAIDSQRGEIRAVELDGHPFFVATLFQPERQALSNRPAPVVRAFLRACHERALRLA